MPGNPAEAMMARFHGRVNPAAIHALEVAFGVNTHQSLISSYFSYVSDLLHGNLGISLTDFPEPVSQVVMKALPWSLGLVGVTTILAFIVGTAIGALSAWRRGGWMDSVLPPVFIVISAFPYFFVGLLVVWYFGITLGWFPLSFAYNITLTESWSWSFIVDVLYHAVLPAFTILITSIGGWILTMRNNTITVVAEDYIKMAQAKGIKSSRILWRYAARNAFLPNLTGFAMSLGFVISGAILVEYVFNYPGLGYMLLQAVENEDFPLMQALFLMITVAVLVAIFLSDILTTLLDPRTRGSS
jgi:peptide/nickel transport system permease protein